LLWLYLCF